jgi:hypothetical protein
LNTTITSFGFLGEEKMYEIASDGSGPINTTSKGVVQQASNNNLLNDLVYEIISDGEHSERPKDYKTSI